MAATYKDAGVDLDVYAESMSRLPRLMHRTFSPRVIPSDGGFAGLFRLDFDGKLSVKISTDLIWQSGKGLVFKITVATNNSTSIGFGGNKIEVTQNDRLMLLSVGNTGLDINFD